MSRNVSKPSKRPSYHLPQNYSHTTTSPHYINHLSLDLSKEKDLVTLPKESSIPQNISSPQNGMKKLGLFLDPHKDKSLAAQVMSGNSLHVSPKNFLEVSKKLNKPKTPSNNGNMSSDFSLISPKDLVRKAMSKMKSKENVKQEVPRATSANKAHSSKAASLSLNTMYVGSEKQLESNKAVATTTLEDNLFFSGSPNHEKAEKMKKLKKIYNDDLSRMTRLNTYSSYEDNINKGVHQKTLSSSQSQTGLGYNGGGVSAYTTKQPSRAPSTTFSNQGEEKRRKSSQTKSKEKVEKEKEKGHKKVGSIGQIDLFTKKELKPSVRQRTKSQGNKIVEVKKTGNPQRLSPASFSQAHNVYHHPYQERPDSPELLNLDEEYIDTIEEGPLDTEELLTDDGALSVTTRDDNKLLKALSRDIKKDELQPQLNNNFIKPATVQNNKETHQLNKAPLFEKIDLATPDNVKFAKSTLLEKLRDTLGSKEFVKREEYERILRERIEMEEEMCAVKEENLKLRGFFMHLQSTGWPNESELELREIIIQQQKELQVLRKREEAVKKIFQLIKKTGIEIEDFNTTTEEEVESQSQYTEKEFLGSESVHGHGHGQGQKPVVNVYAMNAKNNNKDRYALPIPNQAKITHTEASIPESQCSKEILEIEETILEAQSCGKVSDEDNSIFCSQVKKNKVEAKSTADSSPLFSANALSTQSVMKAKNAGKLNIDLTRLGLNNVPTVKSNEVSSQSSAEKVITQYIATNGGQYMNIEDLMM